MNVLISVNEFAYIGAKLTVFSFMKYHKNVNWFITSLNVKIDDKQSAIIHNHVGINDTMIKELTRIVKYFDDNSNVKYIDVTDLFKENLLGSPNDLSGFTPFAAIRLMSDLFIPNYIHDLLYLDIDTITCANITDEYIKYTRINSPYAAYVVPDACDDKGEMVSSVLFFNMDKCRDTNFFKTARKNYMKYQYKYPDQMAIRDTCDPVEIEESLNYMRPLYESDEPYKIVHFSNKLSPKIYGTTVARFFKIFPQFKYLQEELDLFDSINHD